MFRSKRGNVMRLFQDFCYRMRDELDCRDVILDGELVVLDAEGRQDFASSPSLPTLAAHMNARPEGRLSERASAHRQPPQQPRTEY